MSHTAIIAAVVGSAYVAFSVCAPTTAAKAPAEKCFGVAKVPDNGRSFLAVPAGTCKIIGGSLMPFDGKKPKESS